MIRAPRSWATHVRRGVALWVTRLRERPISAYVQVTNRCDRRCPSCGFWRRPAAPGEELSVEEHRRVARQLATLGCCHVSLEGGEPLLREDLVEIVSAYAAHHPTALFTSGARMTAPLAARLFRAGLARACVSIDFADEAEHDRRRGEGAARSAWAAVELLRDAAPRAGRQVEVASIWMKANQHALAPLLERSRARGVGHLVSVLSTSGDRRHPGGDEPPEPAAVAEAIALWTRHRHLRVPSDYLRLAGAFLVGAPLPRCRAGLQSLNVDHRGAVSPCVDRVDAAVGNVRDATVAALWRRLVAADLGRECQACWVLCRGYAQLLGKGGGLRPLLETAVRA